MLKKSTVNYAVNHGGIDWRRLRRAPPAVRLQAQHSNELWQCDISPSDLKHLTSPAWVDATRGQPTLRLYRVVDDRSGVAYQAYHWTYGEAVETAVPFLCNAMTSQADARFPFGGRPVYLYADHGPVTQSHVFQRVMDARDMAVRTHLPAGQDGRRPTARAHGTVERPFRTVKEVHEPFYHCHQPHTAAEANAWLLNSLLRDNDRPPRSKSPSRMEDWVQNWPPEGVREMGSWERFCAFAREPATRKVAVDARVRVAAVRYEVDPDLAGETVTVWFGLYDDQLAVEHGEQRYGPYAPSDGPIPWHRYRRFKKTRSQQRAGRMDGLAEPLSLPRAALSAYPVLSATLSSFDAVQQPFVDPEPFHALVFPSALDAKQAIADHLAFPVARLGPEPLSALNALLQETLAKKAVWEPVRRHLEPIYRHEEDTTMRSGVREHCGCRTSLKPVAYDDSEDHPQLLKELQAAIHGGGLVALTGIVGSGKTVLVSRLQQHRREAGQIEVGESLVCAGSKVPLTPLTLAFYSDLATAKDGDITGTPAKSERALMKVMGRYHKPIALFIDDAHDVHGQTLRA